MRERKSRTELLVRALGVVSYPYVNLGHSIVQPSDVTIKMSLSSQFQCSLASFLAWGFV
jgi:hypothetical protein